MAAVEAWRLVNERCLEVGAEIANDGGACLARDVVAEVEQYPADQKDEHQENRDFDHRLAIEPSGEFVHRELIEEAIEEFVGFLVGRGLDGRHGIRCQHFVDQGFEGSDDD